MPAWRAGAGLCLALLLAGGAAHGAKPTERSRQKAVAEQERAGLQQKLTALKRDIGRTETAKDDAADTLAESEGAISNANRALRELAVEQNQTGVKLRQLGAARGQLVATVELQKKQLSKLLREQYVAGNEDRIKLLLSGDNPNRINRDLQMMSYVSQAQARLLGALRANLLAVEANQAEAQNAKDELEEIAQEEREQKTLLEQEKGRRAALLASLSKRLVEQRKEAGNVERDEQRMAGLVDKLAKLIKEQAEAAAAEKQRQQQLAQARAEAKAKADAVAAADAKARALAATAARATAQAQAERLAREQAKGGKAKPPTPARPEPVAPDEPKVAQRRPEEAKPEPTPEAKPVVAAVAAEPVPARASLAAAAPEGAFAGLRGQLQAPVAGRLAAKFGSKRGDGPSWKGVFIRAGEGADIKSVAAGRVVFAEWLRGFGNLIIVDHGGQYMSIYGNNQALLKRAGDAVKGGDAIASAGNSGGNEESGLYFELRHQGRAFDPVGWVKF
ncbi:murein hydrolase activator [Janthinobacterium sp. CG_23.3]|uniref:murein hydrolase activator EnvC family protein n=1 Tax=unclassified Janthinobacterium TaxID=2610881 RepID=UPI0003484FA6|nr:MULTISPECIES: peptidoglycan DD-metalloendopeptidase family protein [unclassified Janthinobacterium]MEC5158949.1 septal ring factor EnvC (AmiA/AmiB activator) [Janthinobacterium sp. CG_S6]